MKAEREMKARSAGGDGFVPPCPWEVQHVSRLKGHVQ